MQDAAHFQRRYRLTSGQNDVTTKTICEAKKRRCGYETRISLHPDHDATVFEVALKCIAGQLNPIQLNFSRFLVGGLVLVPLAVRELKKRRLSLDGRALGTFALLGLMGIAVSMSLYQLAVARVQASVVGVLFSSNPVFVTLFAFLLLREKISKNQILGLALDVIGIVLIIQPWHLKLDALGVTYILLGTLLFALYGVCGKRQCARFGGLVVSCFSFLLGAAEMMEVTSAQTTSLVFFFKPALAPLLAFLILHEAIPGNMLAGIVCILCGSLASILPGLLAQRRAVPVIQTNACEEEIER